MNQRNHLTEDEIERYAALGSEDTESARFESHIAGCRHCQLRLLDSERQELGVLQTDLGSAMRSLECPPEEMLLGFAAGRCTPAIAQQILLHVSECSYCAPLLKEYLAAIDIGPEPQPLRIILMNRLHIVLSPFAVFTRLFRQHPILSRALTGIAFVLLAVRGVPSFLNAYQLFKADNLLAAAFQETRPNEMRPAWAPHAKFDVQKRGPGPVQISHFPKLSEATSIAAKMEASSDPRWLVYRGRVDLLAGYDDAATLLATAVRMGKNDPSTQIDLALAYFQRDIDLSRKAKTVPELNGSVDLLLKVLRQPKLSPDERAVAQFNLAVAYQLMRERDIAAAAWEEYLRLDPAGPWHDEARDNLEEVQKNNSVPRPPSYREPAFFLHHLAEPEVIQSLEEYQDLALRTWVLDATLHLNSDAELATHDLAELLERQHGDAWMNEFLAAQRPSDVPALRALSAAVTSNRRGQYLAAREKAQDAFDRFHAFNNIPGQRRAEFEVVYANQRLLEDRICFEQARKLAQELATTRYRWLQVQAALEQATCFVLTHVAAKERLDKAKQAAAIYNFRILSLRTQALDASIDASRDCHETWQKVQIGLEQYWQGPSSPQRLYEFYSPLKQCLEKRTLWHAAEVVERQMIHILENEIDPEDTNPLLQATAHSSLEQILRRLDDNHQAEEQATIAIQLLEKVEKRIAYRFKVPTEIELADLQLERGDADDALSTVQRVEKSLDATHFFDLSFYRVRGDVEAARQDWKDAADDYEHGIEIAEKGLSGLTEEDRQRWNREAADVYRGLAAILLEQSRNQEALQLLEYHRYRPFERMTSTKPSPPGPKWTDIQQRILQVQPIYSGSTRLVYLNTRNRLYILTITNKGIKTARVDVKRHDLQYRINQYLERCSAPLPAQDAESEYLFSELLQPAIANLQFSEIVTVDRDLSMNGLPLEALKSPEGWYFGAKFPVIYSPGYLRENDLRLPSPATPRRGLFVDALRTQTERGVFATTFPEVKVVDGMDITPEELRPLLEQSEIFAFVGHGEKGSLILNGRDILQARDFPAESLTHLQLAVLAACSTGLSPDNLVDMNGLIHAFQAGGTPNVIASQWDVDSRATNHLMTIFYGHLKAGEPVVRALYEARKQVMSEAKHEHPYYWAGFLLNGRL